METITNYQDSAIVRAIKTAGIGKKGSKPLPPELIQELLAELKTKSVSETALGAFFGALIMKGVEPHEQILEEGLIQGSLSDYAKLIENIAPNAPYRIKHLCCYLLDKKELSLENAYELGQFLFSNEPGDGARGLCASILRVRYETDDEYEGLLKAIEETFDPTISQFWVRTQNSSLIQIADPFDGVDHSNIITPLVADYLQTLNYQVVSVTGRSSGPKLVYNLYDVAKKLNTNFLDNRPETIDNRPRNTYHLPDRQAGVTRNTFGNYLNQKDLSKAMDRWVDIRRQIIKRPFLATLERFVNPFKADILIASAFHAPYGEKMLTIAERAGFPKIIIVRNGMEGSTAFPLMRPVKILLSRKNSNQQYERHELTFDPKEFFDHKIDIEEKLDRPDLATNIALIEQYKKEEASSNLLFNDRVRFTCYGLTKSIKWVTS